MNPRNISPATPSRASARHCAFSSGHDKDSGFVGRVAFCATASCAAVGALSTTTRLLRAHPAASWSAATRL
jgi:hypothetical protein